MNGWTTPDVRLSQEHPVSTLIQNPRPAPSAGHCDPPAAGHAISASTGTTHSGELSKLGRMFSTLEFLATADPGAFRALTSGIAEELHDAASLASGRHGTWLADMARRFAAAAQEGSTDPILMATQERGRFRFCAREFQAIRAIATTAVTLRGEYDEPVTRVWDGIYDLVERTATFA